MVRRCGPAGSVLAPRLAPGSRFRELSARPGGYPSWLKGALSRVNRQIWPTSPRSPVRIGSPRLWIRSFHDRRELAAVVWFTARPRRRPSPRIAESPRVYGRFGPVPVPSALSVSESMILGCESNRDGCLRQSRATLSNSLPLWLTGQLRLTRGCSRGVLPHDRFARVHVQSPSSMPF